MLQSHILRQIRRSRSLHVLDSSGMDPDEAAIYTLSDPRDVRLVRYVGQTRSPSARFSQHMRAAQLWLPDELPWWVRREELRPLYTWIRALYREEGRLPMMLIARWTPAAQALADERAHIDSLLAQGLSLFNASGNPMRNSTSMSCSASRQCSRSRPSGRPSRSQIS